MLSGKDINLLIHTDALCSTDMFTFKNTYNSAVIVFNIGAATFIGSLKKKKTLN